MEAGLRSDRACGNRECRCIATLAGPDQIEMGRRVLETALRDPGLAADPKTEPSL